MQPAANEAFSRVLIDKALEFSGWNLLDSHQVRFELNPENGRAEYLVCGQRGPLCVLDAKSGELKESVVLDTSEKITVEATKESNAHIVPKNAVLVAMYGATVGETSILGIDAAIRKLEASQATSRTDLDALFQSMLHRAFNGEL